MRLLAIDPGSNKLGYAIFNNEELIELGHFKSTTETPLKRRLQMADELAKTLDSYDLIACEEPTLQGRNNIGMNRLLGYIEYLAHQSILDVSFVHPMTLKKFTGNGSSEKLDMALAAGNMLKTDKEKELLAMAIEKEDFDATDAACVGLWFLNKEVKNV